MLGLRCGFFVLGLVHLFGVGAVGAQGGASRGDLRRYESLGQRYGKELRGRGGYWRALRTAKARLRLAQRAFGTESAQVESALEAVGFVHKLLNDAVSSGRVYRELVALKKRKHGAGAQAVALAEIQLAEALRVFRPDEAATIYERVYPRFRDDPYRGPSLAVQWASLLISVHALSDAEQLLVDASRRAGPSPQRPLLLSSLARLYSRTGDRVKLLATLDRMEPVNVSRPGSAEIRVDLLREVGARKRADDLLQRTLRTVQAHIKELRERGAPEGDVMPHVQSLLRLFRFLDRFPPETESYWDQVIRAASAQTKDRDAKVALALSGKASVLVARAKLKEALALGKRMFKWYRRTVWGTWPASALMGQVESLLGHHGAAVGHLQRALQGQRRQFGKDNPNLVAQTALLSKVQWKAKRYRPARDTLEHALAVERGILPVALSRGSEGDIQKYIRERRGQVDLSLSLALSWAPAAPLALRTVLERKGRALDALSQSLRNLREHLDKSELALFEELTGLRSQLASLVLSGATETAGKDAEYGKAVRDLQTRIVRVEAALRKKSARFRRTEVNLTVRDVQRRVPGDAVLLEFVTYREPVVLSQDPSPRRYAVILLRRRGDPVVMDLGEAAPLESLVAEFREALKDPSRRDVRRLGKGLFGRLLEPVPLKPGERLLLAPDGVLNLVPFAALVTGEGRFLIEERPMIYLTSGRDLLYLNDRALGRGVSVVADPSFDHGAGARRNSRGRRSHALAQTTWERLPGTASEAKAVKGLFPSARLLMGKAATESAVQRLRNPRVLHVATHGFFLPGADPAQGSGGDATGHALLRSGLVFTGSNHSGTTTDDGVLTALEASGMRLEGTELVVLSACETGVGKVVDGEGLYGLRRAMVIAGARSTVMSLWQVDDRATQHLMVKYYQHLKNGEGRGEALRRVQRAMLRRREFRHPFYWAAFFHNGAWSPLKM